MENNILSKYEMKRLRKIVATIKSIHPEIKVSISDAEKFYKDALVEYCNGENKQDVCFRETTCQLVGRNTKLYNEVDLRLVIEKIQLTFVKPKKRR